MNDTADTDFALDALENLRRRLLDLTARNRLLNFPHGRQGNARIIDELPDELHRLLLSEEELRFRAVPDPTREQLIDHGYIEVESGAAEETRVRKDPTAAEWARLLGLNTNYELPLPTAGGEAPDKHTDKVIQTLMFPAEMESRLRGLRNRAETAIEETGANICYVAFGFLEWYESPDSEASRFAPLLLVPVRIAKGRLNRQAGTYDYTIAYTGEDILPNLSLREKLRIDFGLALPDLDVEVTPEAYFAQVAELIEKPQPRWRVRRYATVALFNFAKLLMYLDLDVERWPTDRRVTDHPIVRRFFTESQAGDAVDFAPEHPIDDLPDAHEHYPLVEDADSSQHSALVDAVDGKNLVIEGPPGTGKSQTITNLIAAALAKGKRVLFVAEKLAALEVVKRRLDHAGLGDFCLELHSHKTQKRKVLDDIGARLARQGRYRYPKDIDADIARYESLKNELRSYADLVNSDWKRTGLTVHQILAAATRYREALGVDPEAVHPEGYNGDMYTAAVQRESLDDARRLAEVYASVAAQVPEGGGLQSHPWHGVGNPGLELFETGKVCDALSRWSDALRALGERAAESAGVVEIERDAFQQLEALRQVRSDLGAIPRLEGDELLDCLPGLGGPKRAELADLLGAHEAYVAERRWLADSLSDAAIEERECVQALVEAAEVLEGLGVAEETSLADLQQRYRQLERLQQMMGELVEPMRQLAGALGAPYRWALFPNETGLRELGALIRLSGQLRLELLGLREARFDDEALDTLLPELEGKVKALRRAREGLGHLYRLDALPPSDRLDEMRIALAKRGLGRWLDAEWRSARKVLQAMGARKDLTFAELLTGLDDLCQYAKACDSLEQDSRYRGTLGVHFQGLETPVIDLVELRAWYRAVRSEYGYGFGPRVAMGDAVLDMPANVLRGIQSLAQQGAEKLVNEASQSALALRELFPAVEALRSDRAELVGEESPWDGLREGIAHTLESCRRWLNLAEPTVASVKAVVEGQERLRKQVAAWQAGSDALTNVLSGRAELPEHPGDAPSEMLAALTHTEHLARAVMEDVKTPSIRERLIHEPSAALFARVAELSGRLDVAWQEHLECRSEFVELTALDLEAWLHGTGGTIAGLLSRNARALDQPKWLANWLDYVRERVSCVATGLRRLAEALERGLFRPGDIDGAYQLGIQDILAREILHENPRLARFSGTTHFSRQQRYREYDQKLQRLHRERIAWKIAQNEVPRGVSGGRVSSYTERSLLEHESGLQRSRTPLRQLLLRAGDALAALKPCFMMGPMSVAQYLAPGQIEFDLVVMDEASQMKPQDALGAIARGHQLVVVGDPKQLPPTSFFDRMITEDEEDTTGIEESESILDTAMPLFDVRRLRWHYRSQHEHLIAFSNQAFYDSGLVLFPSPYSESPDLGVRFTRVARGRFVNRRNVEEARAVAEAVRTHLLERPEESVGAVAMSAEQRDQLERALEDLAKDDLDLQRALEKNAEREEPLFVKNLENVQGDERDVIFISCTYGPERVGGRVLQRFGPINSNVGWRRLNVLFTRSKKRMHVFSSMGSLDIVVTEQTKRGVHALREFLHFAETGHFHRARITERPPDSDFEVAVAQAVAHAGFECEFQVGVAGFFIDLAVRDPGSPGQFLMGIECDGASYHSAKSTRDRDRLRQQVLESLGWRIRRIWSTDWYRNPQAEIQPILRELEELKTEAPEIPIPVETVTEPEGMAEQMPIESPGVPSSAEPLQTDAGESHEPTGDYEVAEEDLAARLRRFDQDVIRPALPGTSPRERLLRPAMIEALIEYMPITKSEFLERIPSYLRQGTCAAEARQYLSQVLELVEEAETGVTN